MKKARPNGKKKIIWNRQREIFSSHEVLTSSKTHPKSATVRVKSGASRPLPLFLQPLPIRNVAPLYGQWLYACPSQDLERRPPAQLWTAGLQSPFPGGSST